MKRVVRVLHNHSTVIRRERHQPGAFGKVNGDRRAGLNIPNPRLVVSVAGYEETVVPAENPHGQGQAAAGKRRQLAVGIHVADDNVASGVIPGSGNNVPI